ncbi:uncharacterized protein [Mytilus edulis]|uniref:uncharacterized protein n=1 Tax=Mytilus edulis TaxID=6550 RepID=UPI0039EEBE17
MNRNLAFGRLKSNIDRMKKKQGLLKQYDSIIQDQLSKEIIEKVDIHNTEGLVHYIPHHAVISPLKTTTKVRIVYDASAKTKKEVKSLNECLHRGPVLLQNLCGMLIRFRLYRIAIVADIEKGFLQVGLQPSERNVTRFLWLKDCENPTTNKDNIQEYRFCRVPFGVIFSPFLLGATIDSHLMTYKTPCAEQIRHDIYVDNLITGANSVVDAISICSESKAIFREASMNLREWITNDRCVNEFISKEDRINSNSNNVLGHVWDIKNIHCV